MKLWHRPMSAAVAALLLLLAMFLALETEANQWDDLSGRQKKALKSFLNEVMEETHADPMKIIELGRQKLLEQRTAAAVAESSVMCQPGQTGCSSTQPKLLVAPFAGKLDEQLKMCAAALPAPVSTPAPPLTPITLADPAAPKVDGQPLSYGGQRAPLETRLGATPVVAKLEQHPAQPPASPEQTGAVLPPVQPETTGLKAGEEEEEEEGEDEAAEEADGDNQHEDEHHKHDPTSSSPAPELAQHPDNKKYELHAGLTTTVAPPTTDFHTDVKPATVEAPVKPVDEVKPTELTQPPVGLHEKLAEEMPMAGGDPLFVQTPDEQKNNNKLLDQHVDHHDDTTTADDSPDLPEEVSSEHPVQPVSSPEPAPVPSPMPSPMPVAPERVPEPSPSPSPSPELAPVPKPAPVHEPMPVPQEHLPEAHPEAHLRGQPEVQPEIHQESHPGVQPHSHPEENQVNPTPVDLGKPVVKEYEQSFIDTSNPSDPKRMDIKHKEKVTVKPNGETHEHYHSSSASSLNNPNNFSQRWSHHKHSFSSTSTKSFVPNGQKHRGTKSNQPKRNRKNRPQMQWNPKQDNRWGQQQQQQQQQQPLQQQQPQLDWAVHHLHHIPSLPALPTLPAMPAMPTIQPVLPMPQMPQVIFNPYDMQWPFKNQNAFVDGVQKEVGAGANGVYARSFAGGLGNYFGRDIQAEAAKTRKAAKRRRNRANKRAREAAAKVGPQTTLPPAGA